MNERQLGTEDHLPTPKWLYKYRSLTGESAEFTRQIVQDSKLYFASAAEFNDPFDSLPAISIDGTTRQLRSYLQHAVDQSMPGAPRADRRRVGRQIGRQDRATLEGHLQEAGRLTAAGLGICSLSARPDHVLMWSHYAANHSGICLRFSSSPILSSISMAQPVRYSCERPIVNRVRSLDHVSLYKALITKADFWSYEEEWRAMSPSLNPGLVAFPPQILDGIIFGARASAEMKRQVRSWIRDRDIALFDAAPARDTFRIDLRPSVA